MKRLVLFVIALVFAFCTTVMAADQPTTAGTATPAPAKKEMKAKKAKKATMKKATMKKDTMKKDTAPAAAPAAK